MIEVNLLRELYDHMTWADAEVWRAVTAIESAPEDEALHNLLAHIHFTQEAFSAIWAGREFVLRRPQDFASLEEIRAFALPFYKQIPDILSGENGESLAAPMPVPWAKYFARSLGREPQGTTRGETMMQVALHTQYHRGQINARIRVLGATPPMVDYIGWLWAGRPDAAW